jgi:hypothetical protein
MLMVVASAFVTVLYVWEHALTPNGCMDKGYVIIFCTEKLSTDPCAICIMLQCALPFPVFVDNDQSILVVFHNVVGHMKFVLVSVDSELLQ